MYTVENTYKIYKIKPIVDAKISIDELQKYNKIHGE